MSTVPEVSFARSGSIDIAYQVVGDGPLDIVFIGGWASHLEVIWELPEARHFLDRLSGMGRLVMFDKRGTGLSDRPPTGSTTSEMVPDVIAVMDAAGVEQAAIAGWSDGAAIAMMTAAAHPDRVQALVLAELLATATPDEGHPWGPDPQAMEGLAGAIELGMWGQAIVLPLIAPSAAEDERILNWWRKMERMSATPSMAADLLRRTMNIDLRPLMPDIKVPVLLLHRRDAPLVPAEAMRWFADELGDGRYVEVPGDELPGYLGDVDALMDEVEEFLLGTRVGSALDRRIITVLFSDVVGSTERAAAVGDRRWHELLEAHRTEARRLLARYGGFEVDTAGDGFLIAFDTSTPAIQCALALCKASKAAGLQIRIGIHTGEVVYQSGKVTGMAVHIGARVAALAAADEVLVSQTVRDLLVGSGLQFTSKGRYDLKGVPGAWEVYRVD